MKAISQAISGAQEGPASCGLHTPVLYTSSLPPLVLLYLPNTSSVEEWTKESTEDATGVSSGVGFLVYESCTVGIGGERGGRRTDSPTPPQAIVRLYPAR